MCLARSAGAGQSPDTAEGRAPVRASGAARQFRLLSDHRYREVWRRPLRGHLLAVIGAQGFGRMLQAEPGPQEEPMIGAAGSMLVPGPPYPSGPHAIDRPERRLGRHAAKPFRQWDAKAFLFAFDDLFRQQAP